MSSDRACFPSEVHTSTDRLCSAGSRCLLFPGVKAPMRSSDSLVPIGRRYGRPLRAAYHRCPVEVEGLPGFWVVLFVRAAILNPVPRPHPLAQLARVGLLPSSYRALSARDTCTFRGQLTRPTSSRTYASTSPLPSSLQGPLPACRARLWPGGFRTRWTTNEISGDPLSPSFSTSLTWSHRDRASSADSRAWPRPRSAHRRRLPALVR